jgi:hypothetical protein
MHTLQSSLYKGSFLISTIIEVSSSEADLFPQFEQNKSFFFVSFPHFVQYVFFYFSNFFSSSAFFLNYRQRLAMRSAGFETWIFQICT